MATITHEITLEIGSSSLPFYKYMKEGDGGSIYFKITLMANGVKFTPASGDTALIRVLKADGNSCLNPATINNDGTITALITQQMTAAPGTAKADIVIQSSNGSTISTATFFLDIDFAPVGESIESTSEVLFLIDMVNRGEYILGKYDSAIGEITEAKNQALDDAAVELTEMVEAAKKDIGDEGEAAAEAISDLKDEALKDLRTKSADTLQEFTDAKDEAIAVINRKATQVQQIATEADAVAAQALEKATSAENETAEFSAHVEEVEGNIETLILQMADRINGGYVENGVGYFTADGRVIFEMTGMGGGGSGGGDSGSNSEIKMTNTTGWMSNTIADGDHCNVSFAWSSIEDEMPTGNGVLTISINDMARASFEVPQGENTIDVSPYLKVGTNKVDLAVSDIYGKSRNIRVMVTSVALLIESSFDASAAHTGVISFPYIPTGNVRKTVYFIMDGSQIGTQETSVSGKQQSFTIPAQSHGAHTFRVYFEAEINGQTVRSNELYYEIICIDPLSEDVIIVSDYNATTAKQYETLLIPYTIYDPLNLETAVSISVNGEVVTTLTADRTTQTFSYRVDTPGSYTIVISCGGARKTFSLTVSESEIHPEAVTDRLTLYLSAAGRSNSEDNPGVWEYGEGQSKIAAVFSGFNWTRNGWVLDDSGQTCLRVMGGATVQIPVQIFASDFVNTGKTVEIEFAAHDVMDYDATIISCMSGGRGFEIKADNASFKSTRGDIGCRFAAETHMRLTYSVHSRSDYRLMYLYIDGEYQGIKQYSNSGSFAQVDPVGITIGSEGCAVDIYSIRIYDRYLNDDEVLGNFIADRQDVAEMLSLYRSNDIKDANGNIVISKLPASLPYGIFEGPESPQYKGDKKTVIFDYFEPLNAARRLHADGVSINVQGTSSQYYAVKNFKFKMPDGCTVNGRLVAGFVIRDGEIMVNEFTLKADVASSESANNDILEKLYNDLSKQLGILTPPQKVNSAVRVGIDGFPFVLFWNYGDGPEFVGKYNFNNDKGTFDTFGFQEGDEAWDVRSNTSQLSKFHTATLNSDWYTEDYESIFPEEYSDSSKLLPMTEFIYSTWQENATGATLETPVTYDGVEYTTDSAAYRLAKFKAEYGNWYDLNNAAFYYVFTLVLLMVDSRQKNEHLAYWAAIKKWWELIWDCDTALGNDNRGHLTFEYWMEDIDVVASTGENVYNGADNVKWVNFRQAFWNEAKEMYQRMRSSGIFSAEYLKTVFHEWQSAWPKAVWNEDGDFKYVTTVRSDNDTQYLDMAYGSKGWQRDEFLDWRFPYCDSMFDVGDALLSIMFRPYYNVTEEQRAAGAVDLTIDVYKYSYVTVVFDSTKVSQRVINTNSCVIHNPLSFASDAVCGIHNGKMIKDVHGLENLYVGFWDSSNAPNLQAIRLGSNAEGYENLTTKTVSVGVNKKLREVDLRNCVNFGTDDQKTLDLSHCENIQKVYLDGTSAMGVELPNGGILEELHLPATTTSIVLRNHPNLTAAKFVIASYANIDQLWLENMTGLDSLAMLRSIPASTAIRITGFHWECTNATEIEGIYTLLDTMRGISINGQGEGEEVDVAQVSGTIHTNSLRGDQIAAWKARYPSITVTADHVESTLTCKSYDGSSTVKTITCIDGVPQESLPSPSRSSTAQYSYTFIGWNTKTDQETADPDCITNVQADRTVYAAYSKTVQTYTVTWKNSDGTVLETDTNVPYGTRPTYNGATPQNPTSGGGAFQGWTPAISNVTGNITYTASYVVLYTVRFFNGSTLLDTVQVASGGTATYTGETPVDPDGGTFKGWEPAPTNVTANRDCYAQFKPPVTWTDPGFNVANAYAVQWPYSGDATALARGGLAARFADPSPATALAGSGSSPFDNVAPWKDMKRYNIIDGTISYSQDDAGFSEADYDTVVFIPTFYFHAEKDTTNQRWTWAISPTAQDGYTKHPGSGRYVGRFHTSGSADGVFSKSGVAPLVNTSRPNFRTYSHNKGEKWWMLDLATWSALQMLYLVEFADFHSQSTLGTGHNTGSAGNTGGTTGAAYHTLKISSGDNMYRWVENPFSQVRDWVDGFMGSRSNTYIGLDNSTFADSTSNLTATGIALPSSNYITGFGYSEQCPWAFIPDAASGGSASTYVPDYVSSNTSNRALYVGGYYSAFDYYGFFYFYGGNNATNTYAYLGSRLLYIP